MAFAPGARWGDVPEDWGRPDCGTPKSGFEMVVIGYGEGGPELAQRAWTDLALKSEHRHVKYSCCLRPYSQCGRTGRGHSVLLCPARQRARPPMMF